MKPIYFSRFSLYAHIQIYNCLDVHSFSLNFRITTSAGISAPGCFEAFAACFDRSRLSLSKGSREYSAIFWNILSGRQIQTTRPGIKKNRFEHH